MPSASAHRMKMPIEVTSQQQRLQEDSISNEYQITTNVIYQ